MHYYKFNIPDWNLGTNHLSLIEEAIYFRLLNHYYDTETPIPLETQSVFRRLRMGNESDIAASILQEFFVKTEKGYVHGRCEKILKEYKKNNRKNAENGAKGGRPRKDAAFSETQEKPTGLFSETEQEPKDNPNQELLTINQEPETNVKELVPQQAATPKKRAIRLPDDWRPDKSFWDAALANNPGMTQEWFVSVAHKFKDYWIAKSGKDATKADWLATWRNWVRREVENGKGGHSQAGKQSYGQQRSELFDAVTDYERATNF
jgi:uncharacterized protein YdaU (DUF1376 family)